MAQPALPDPPKHSREKLQKLIARLEATIAKVRSHRLEPGTIDALEAEINQRLVESFGLGTASFNRYNHARHISAGAINWEELQEHKSDSIGLLETALNELRENLSDMGEESPTTRILRAFAELDLHPEIEREAGKRYADGYYADAVENAVKVLDGLVVFRSGIRDLTGAKLVQKAFSVNDPVLRFNKLETPSDKDEQRGFMMLFDGAVTALRNPRSHSFIQDDPERALEYIAFISLLAKLLDEAERV